MTVHNREAVALYYVNLFPARTDVYSHWTGGPEDGGWRPVKENLTPAIAVAGLTKTGPSISGFMIAPGGVSHSLAIDFDDEDGYKQAIKVGRTMHTANAPAYVERSGRGAHLWAVLEQTMQARSIRRALRWWIQRSGLDPEDPKIELRPGSDDLPEGGLGHALRLPLMPHPRTGHRGRLINPVTGELVGANLGETLLNIETIPCSSIVEAAMLFVPKPNPLNIPLSLRNVHAPREEDTASAAGILRELWGVENAQPGRAVRCPAHDDKRPSLSILRDDRRVICRSPSCILNNNDRGRGTHELEKLAPVRS